MTADLRVHLRAVRCRLDEYHVARLDRLNDLERHLIATLEQRNPAGGT